MGAGLGESLDLHHQINIDFTEWKLIKKGGEIQLIVQVVNDNIAVQHKT
jgi:hypothetical protein